jgi:hypothetical protein
LKLFCFLAFRWVRYTRAMTYDEFKRQLARAGLTIQQLADLLNKPRAAITNYSVTGRVPDHFAVISVLMAELADAGVDFVPAIERLGIQRKRVRGAGFEPRTGRDEG